MNYTVFIARKYLRAKRKTGFISIISGISIVGVALGSAALIVTLCIISGFENELRSKFISFDSHVRLKTFESTPRIDDPAVIAAVIKSLPHAKFQSPYIEKEAMIRSKKATDGIMVKGVDRNLADSVLNIDKTIIQSKNGARLTKGSSDKLAGILIGKKLADKLYAGIGDKLTLFSLQNSLAFVQQPRVKQFEITGIYRSGLSEYDNIYVFIDLRQAQDFFDYGEGISGIEMRLDDAQAAPEVAEQLNSKLGYPYYAKTWFDLHRNLFGWLETNNFIMMIIFSLIIIVAAFNIIGTLFMIVIEKTRDIGILKSMGASPAAIRTIFLWEGLFIGSIGTGAGVVLAFILVWVQKTFKVIGLDSDVYFMDSVPIEIKLQYFLGIALFSVILCTMATLYPSITASRLNAIDAIRYE